MFDIRDIHQTITGRDDCEDFIQNNKNRLSRECHNNLKLFDPTRGDVPSCDGGLLRHMINKYAFVVQLSNYTKRWCTDGLYPVLIYFNITQIIQCERDIRQALRSSPQDYSTYNSLSHNLLDIYIKNLNNYRNCNDPQSDEEIDSSTLYMLLGDNCG
jgi:hypothetical protein